MRSLSRSAFAPDLPTAAVAIAMDCGETSLAMVPPAVRERVQAKRAEIVAGRERIFTGPIADQAGTVRIPAGAVAADQELLGMNWFVQGVVGTTE